MALTDTFLFGKKNFMIVLIGLGVIFIGFLLLMGGATTDPLVYPEDEMYGFRRTILAPFVILVGFIIQIFAIFDKSSAPLTAPEDTSRRSSSSKKSSVLSKKGSRKR